MRAPFLHGGVAKARRDAMVADFQAGLGPPLLLVSLKAGGTGLNLTAASQVIHYDRWWNPAVEDQATDRAWRIGQGRTVNVHKLVCEGTVEERIATMIDDKRALADAVVGSGEAWLSELSTSELRELVRLDAGGERMRPRRSFGADPKGRLPAAMLRALAAELADPARFGRAKAYARDDAVTDIQVEPGIVRGVVHGHAPIPTSPPCGSGRSTTRTWPTPTPVGRRRPSCSRGATTWRSRAPARTATPTASSASTPWRRCSCWPTR